MKTLIAIRQELAQAMVPAMIAAVVIPILIAITPARDIAAHFLPAGAERLLVTGVGAALLAEIIRVHWVKWRIAARLSRLEQQEVAHAVV